MLSKDEGPATRPRSVIGAHRKPSSSKRFSWFPRPKRMERGKNRCMRMNAFMRTLGSSSSLVIFCTGRPRRMARQMASSAFRVVERQEAYWTRYLPESLRNLVTDSFCNSERASWTNMLWISHSGVLELENCSRELWMTSAAERALSENWKYKLLANSPSCSVQSLVHHLEEAIEMATWKGGVVADSSDLRLASMTRTTLALR